MFELSGVNYEEVLEQGDSILVRVYRGFELSGGSSYRDYTVHIFTSHLLFGRIKSNTIYFYNYKNLVLRGGGGGGGGYTH